MGFSASEKARLSLIISSVVLNQSGNSVRIFPSKPEIYSEELLLRAIVAIGEVQEYIVKREVEVSWVELWVTFSRLHSVILSRLLFMLRTPPKRWIKQMRALAMGSVLQFISPFAAVVEGVFFYLNFPRLILLDWTIFQFVWNKKRNILVFKETFSSLTWREKHGWFRSITYALLVGFLLFPRFIRIVLSFPFLETTMFLFKPGYPRMGLN